MSIFLLASLCAPARATETPPAHAHSDDSASDDSASDDSASDDSGAAGDDGASNNAPHSDSASDSVHSDSVHSDEATRDSVGDEATSATSDDNADSKATDSEATESDVGDHATTPDHVATPLTLLDGAEPLTIATLIVRAEDGRLTGRTGEDLRERMLSAGRDAGWPFLGFENPLFGTDRSGEATFVLGGEILEVYRAATAHREGWGLDVRWELLDRRSDQVVYETTTSGWIPGSWDSGDDRSVEILTSALHHLLARPHLVDLLQARAALAPSSNDPLDVRRCAVRPDPLPAGMEAVLAATVRLSNGNSHGSGVLISPDGWVLTAAHVVDGSAQLQAHTRTGLVLPATRVRHDAGQDIALVHLPGSGHPCLPLAEAPPAVGAPAWLVGSPLDPDLDWSVSAGVVSGRRSIEGSPFLQTDAATNPGNSGGPLVDAAGSVLGLMSWKLVAGAEGLAFAAPAPTAVERLGLAWSEHSSAPPPPSPGEPPQRIVDPPGFSPERDYGEVCIWLGASGEPREVGIGESQPCTLSPRSWSCWAEPTGELWVWLEGEQELRTSVTSSETTYLRIRLPVGELPLRLAPATKPGFRQIKRRGQEAGCVP